MGGWGSGRKEIAGRSSASSCRNPPLPNAGTTGILPPIGTMRPSRWLHASLSWPTWVEAQHLGHNGRAGIVHVPKGEEDGLHSTHSRQRGERRGGGMGLQCSAGAPQAAQVQSQELAGQLTESAAIPAVHACICTCTSTSAGFHVGFQEAVQQAHVSSQVLIVKNDHSAPRPICNMVSMVSTRTHAPAPFSGIGIQG